MNLWMRDETVAPARQARFGQLECIGLLGEQGTVRNVLTTLLHRAECHLGPWSPRTDTGWTSTSVAGKVCRLVRYAPLEICEAAVASILEERRLLAGGWVIKFGDLIGPRQHQLFRSHSKPRCVQSPFGAHSASILEYRSFDDDVLSDWNAALGAEESHLGRPFDPTRHTDRVGNIVVARAHDEHTFHINAGKNCVIFTAEHHRGRAGLTVTLFADYAGDRVLHQQLPVMDGDLVVQVESEVDHIGFEVHRNSDGYCVDQFDAHLLMEVGTRMHIQTAPDIEFSDKSGKIIHRVNGRTAVEPMSIDLSSGGELDRRIRRRHLGAVARARELEVRREGDIVRFPPKQSVKAAAHLAKSLGGVLTRKHVVYIADPYFLSPLEGDRLTQLRTYIDILAALRGVDVRLLCSPRDSDPPMWWGEVSKIGSLNVTARGFYECFDQARGTPGSTLLHDRYIAIPDYELILTNSINGWEKRGVTVIRSHLGVYRAEAEHLWSLPLGPSPAAFVREVPL